MRCYCKMLASHTKTMLPTRKSVSRSSRQSDGTKASWPSYTYANCNCMDMSPVHQVWLKPSCKAQRKGEGDKADRGRGGKTTSGSGQAWMFAKSQRAVENKTTTKKPEETRCEIICGVLTTLIAVKGYVNVVKELSPRWLASKQSG